MPNRIISKEGFATDSVKKFKEIFGLIENKKLLKCLTCESYKRIEVGNYIGRCLFYDSFSVPNAGQVYPDFVDPMFAVVRGDFCCPEHPWKEV